MDYLKYFKELENHNLKKEVLKTDLNICDFCNVKDVINYDYINYNKVCSNCGYINDIIIDHSAEWRNYGYSDNKNTNMTRCGNPINNLLPKSSMSTIIKSGGTKFNPIKRLQTWDQISKDERSEYEVFKKIDNIVFNQKINRKIMDMAKNYYKKLCSKDENENKILTRGKNRTSLIVACIYISSQNNNSPINEKKLLQIFKIKKTDLTRGLKKFSELEKSKKININKNNSNIHDLINLYGNQFNFNKDIIKIIHLVYIRSLMINILKNSSDRSVCSGLFYFISMLFKLNLSKKNIIEKINISEVTLNKSFKLFNSYIDVLILGFDKITLIK